MIYLVETLDNLCNNSIKLSHKFNNKIKLEYKGKWDFLDLLEHSNNNSNKNLWMIYLVALVTIQVLTSATKVSRMIFLVEAHK
jgi:hypothetical protein